MNGLLGLAMRSAWNRRFTLGLTLAAIALSVCLLLAVERVRQDAREGFQQSISGTDLVVGARTGPVQLMLYAVFHVGGATSNIRWESVQRIAGRPEVAWTIPLSLGDSHRGFPVLGTTGAYFEHLRYGQDENLRFSTGRVFKGIFEAVLGSDVAARLGYRIGDRIVLNHGTGEAGLTEHADKPFVVTGVLAPTGTPVDRTVHVGLEAIQALHLDWKGGAPIPGLSIPPEYVRKFDLSPKEVTAVLVGLKIRAAVFRVQRFVNDYPEEPLLAVLPGVALDELWEIVGFVEKILLLISIMVISVGLAGLIAVVLAGLNERRRELAILRSVGARPADIFMLLLAESFAVTLLGALAGAVLLGILTAVAAPLVQENFGLVIRPRLLSLQEARWLILVVGAALLASVLPGYRAYRLSLSDGLIPRI